MKEDPVRKAVLEDLRLIRRGRGPVSIDRIAVADRLIRDFGRGSVEFCYSALLEYAAKYGSDPESDVRAFFDTAGFEHADQSLDQRLNAYASVHSVDPRTALRRSDRGAERLSYLIRDSYVGIRPWGHVSLVQNGPSGQFRLEVSIDSGMKWNRPILEVNGQDVDRDVFELHEVVQDPSRLSAVYIRDPEPIVREQEPGFALYRIRIHWQMPVWPTWQTSAAIADPRLYARMIVTRNNSVSVDLDWSPLQDFDRTAPFAFEPVVENPAFTTQNPHQQA